MRYIQGLPLLPTFDGHTNLFVETGFDRAILLDFNYKTDPLPGKFPHGSLGPLHLLQESKLNHWSKLAFHWIYWNVMLKGRPMPMLKQMTASRSAELNEPVTV
jgi:sulfide:quinone oxidoreductase